LGNTWAKFAANLHAIREAGYCTLMDGVDEGFSGVAAAIIGPTGEADSSLSLVLRTEVLRNRGDKQFASLVMRSARMISAAMANPRAGR
jgi:DNA-binding IclR family transcriptional regulator